MPPPSREKRDDHKGRPVLHCRRRHRPVGARSVTPTLEHDHSPSSTSNVPTPKSPVTEQALDGGVPVVAPSSSALIVDTWDAGAHARRRSAASLPEAVGGHGARELTQMTARENGHGDQRRTPAVARDSIVTGGVEESA